jgi:hypothetical protein
VSCGGQWQHNWKQPSQDKPTYRVRCAIHERTRAIWGPLERSLPVEGKGLGRLGYAKLIGDGVGKGYSVHHIGQPCENVAQSDPVGCASRQEPERSQGGLRQFLTSPSILRTYLLPFSGVGSTLDILETNRLASHRSDLHSP